MSPRTNCVLRKDPSMFDPQCHPWPTVYRRSHTSWTLPRCPRGTPTTPEKSTSLVLDYGQCSGHTLHRPKSQSVTILGGAQDERMGPPETARVNRYRVPGSATVIRGGDRRSRNHRFGGDRWRNELGDRRRAAGAPRSRTNRSDR